MGKNCADCRDGEHDDYTEDIQLTVVRDPDTNRLIKRAYLCKEHRAMYLDDGYDIYRIRV